ncbi:hypothetical protein PIB30_074354 [Stylosanthes scabra]|uniref:Zinc finger GRF-type domain-containing protein n=1 Tax=Stylosanthes scabra TaxID=79078 RepID=A0ABU6URY9_9FABA|nr:hypothetical protein [Stylosanthes scabra]
MDVGDRNSHGGESWGTTIGSGGSSVGGTSKKMKKKFVAPICSYGDYAILFQTTTSTNPKRFFLGCQHFKRGGGNCKYFVWLDEYVACFHDNERGNSTEIVEPLKRIKERMSALEKLMLGEAQKVSHDVGITKIRGLLLFMSGFMLAILWNAMFNSSK